MRYIPGVVGVLVAVVLITVAVIISFVSRRHFAYKDEHVGIYLPLKQARSHYPNLPLEQFGKLYPDWEVGGIRVERDKIVLIIHKRGGWIPTAAEISHDGSVLSFGLLGSVRSS